MMKTKWDLPAINYRTERSNNKIKVQEEWIKQIKRDPRLAERKIRQECAVCFYTQRICGQGFTKFNCALCEEEINWSNTCVPMLCYGCAKKNQLCERCGGDIDLRERI